MAAASSAFCPGGRSARESARPASAIWHTSSTALGGLQDVTSEMAAIIAREMGRDTTIPTCAGEKEHPPGPSLRGEGGGSMGGG